MLTNDDDNAIDAVTNFDVRNIRSKSLYQNESDKFIAIINKMIDDYADMATKLEEELRELRSREISGELVAAEEERLIELDELVDKNLDASTSVPRQVKKTSNTERLDSLIVRADAIIEKLGLLDTNE
ncbi:hypothetical protein KDA00_05975 [Candidatus Saccharibacteria bacterium]|nr:hypothetical protein [Candidatus Saccharibacteria bacterium]